MRPSRAQRRSVAGETCKARAASCADANWISRMTKAAPAYGPDYMNFVHVAHQGCGDGCRGRAAAATPALEHSLDAPTPPTRGSLGRFARIAGRSRAIYAARMTRAVASRLTVFGTVRHWRRPQQQGILMHIERPA